MGKNLVIFSDGTGQEGGKGPSTNVYKLFNRVLDRSPDQIAFYDRGLGTGWRKLTGNAAGVGISENICECYEFIFDNYEAGDQLYLFGFSRGATTVRSLSGFIHLFGILPKSRRELIKEAYSIYSITDHIKRKTVAQDFVQKHHNMWCKIKVLGVWDTVAALGLPIKAIDVVIDKIPFFKHSFHDLSLSPSVENAYHALAIDDERLTFHPTLWDSKINDDQTMKQVWFSGMHTDVGGGYTECDLSNIPLEWMIQQVQKHGLKFYKNNQTSISGEPNGFMHNSRGGTFSKFYRRKERLWPTESHGIPVIHESVTQRTKSIKNTNNPSYEPWIMSGDYEIEKWEKP